ncbi:unnamed protein product [Heterobilharzia americana]|nr:unnamed protein product [Heterobilharzia americana]
MYIATDEGPLIRVSINKMSEVGLFGSWAEENNDFQKTNNITHLLDEDPEIFDGSSLFPHFCNLWRNPQISLSEIPVQYVDACHKIVRRLPKIFTQLSHRKGLPNIRSVTEMINLERNTWSLISNIYLDRFESESKTRKAEGNDLSSLNHSEREIIRLLYEKDNELRETQILIDWLEQMVREQIEEVAEKYECLFNQTTAWENTAHLLDYLSESELSKRRLVKELHPDTVIFTGSELDQKDQIENDRYLNYLFLCLRGGDLHRAQLLCTQRGEYWRAISFEGWRPFHYSGFIESESNQLEKLSKEDEQITQSKPFYMKLSVEGNPMRILYKSVCWWNSENIKLRSFERAIYATLSGNLEVLSQVLPASWMDQTWAHCRALVEARVDSSLRSLLNTGPRADTLAVTGKTSKYWPLDGGLSLPDSAWSPGDWTLSDAFARVDARLGWSAVGCLEKCSLRMKSVLRSAMNDFLVDDTSYLYANDDADSNDLQSPSVYAIVYCIFYAVQQTIMLRNYDSFLTKLANIMPKLVSYSLGNGIVSEMSPLQPPDFSRVGNIDQVVCHTLRFLTHFILFLKSAESDIQDEPCSEIIKAYLCFLMVNKETDLVAYYTSTLPNKSLQIQWYSWFLAEIHQPSVREHCLSLAIKYEFDVCKVTREIVKLLKQRIYSSSEQIFTTNQLNSIYTNDILNTNEFVTGLLLQHNSEEMNELTEMDKRQISIMNWLFYDPTQRGEGLYIANSLLRGFIAIRSFKAAQQVLCKLPPGTLEHAKIICEKSNSPNWLVNTIREHECFVLYLKSRDAFAEWYQQVHLNRPVQPSSLTTGNANDFTHTTYGPRGLAQRLAVEEAKKEYLARLERWRHDTRLDTQVAAEKLTALLTYPQPGWLVDIEDEDESNGYSDRGTTTTTTTTPRTTLNHNNTEEQNHLDNMVCNDDNDDDNDDDDDDDRVLRQTNLIESEEDPISGLGENTTSRQLQMNNLRETCLTETVFLLIRLYQTVGLHQKCVELSNLIVDNNYGLFKLFSGSQLQNLLRHISESIQHLIDNEQDPLGYALSTNLSEVVNAGWILSQKSFTEYLKKTEHEKFNELIDLLLNSDIREYGSPWLGDFKKSSQLEANGRIVQLTRLRNISIPQAVEEMMLTNSSDHRGPCLLRLTFTDGRNTITGLDMQDKTDLNIDILPGTKFRLMGSIPISMGFLLLSKNHLKLLGGTVNNLIREWNMTKFLKGTENRNISSGAPAFVPFGSREATDLIQTEGKFLNQLRLDRERNQMKFDSFQMATSRNEEQEESEFQVIFNEQRKEILAELKSSTSTSSNTGVGVKHQNNSGLFSEHYSGRRFRPGLSKFYEIQSQKSMEYDKAIAQLLSLGYPFQLASTALKVNRGNYQGAIDYLLSNSSSTSMQIEDNPMHQTSGISCRGVIRSRGRGNINERGYRGRPNSVENEKIPSRFHSATAISSTVDLPCRPSTGLTRLDDLIVESSLSTQQSSYSKSRSYQLPVGCPILAQNISGDYEEAQLIGSFSLQQFNSSNYGGSSEKVVLVAYLHTDNTGEIVAEEEIVPISLIRTLNRERITLDMLPVAPHDRIKPYCIQSNSETMNSNQIHDIQFMNQSSYQPGRGRRGNNGGRAGDNRVLSGRGRRPRGRHNIN